MFFLAFSERDEFLKLKSSDGEYFIFGNFKYLTSFYFSAESKNYILSIIDVVQLILFNI